MSRLWKINREEVISKLEEWAKKLSAEREDVLAVVLFGSLARGDFTAKSDADLVIILKTSDKEFKDRIPDFIPRGVGISIDVFPYTLEEASKMASESLGVIGIALKEGIILVDKLNLNSFL